MKEIGGYFELELTDRGGFPHDDGILVNSGSNALEYILRSLGDVKCVWVPYFTCSIVLKPFKNTGIPYKFYHINQQLELSDEISLAEGEYLLITNYYGIKDAYISKLAAKYGRHLIVDNAQAFYTKAIQGVAIVYSPRKFLGIPDGGIVCGIDASRIDTFDADASFDRCSHLLKRYDLGATAGYEDFKSHDAALSTNSIKRMSCLTQSLLRSIDHERVKTARKENFAVLHNTLEKSNQLNIDVCENDDCPLVYPYWIPDGRKLKTHLIQHKVFCATYWPNVFDWCKPSDMEYQLAENVVCLPIDQRYGEKEMEYILKLIQDYGRRKKSLFEGA